MGGLDFTDQFAFHWITTGTFQATYSAGSFAGDIFMALLNISFPWNLVAGQQLVGDVLTVPNLAAGDYILVLDAPDPPFTIDIFELNPNGSVNVAIPNPICGIGSDCAVPEASTMVLLGTGLFAAGLRFARRRLGSRGSST